MRRFYRLDLQPDLFGCTLLMKQCGRVGTQGRMVAESFASEEPAAVAMQRQAERTKRPVGTGVQLTGRVRRFRNNIVQDFLEGYFIWHGAAKRTALPVS